MDLLDEVHQLQLRYADADRYERMVLNLAASLLELIQRTKTGSSSLDAETLWIAEDYLDLPDTFELLDGRVEPKHWKMYSDLAGNEEED